MARNSGKTPEATYQKPVIGIIDKKVDFLRDMNNNCVSNLAILEKTLSQSEIGDGDLLIDNSMLCAYEEPLLNALNTSIFDFADIEANIKRYFELLLVMIGFKYKHAAVKVLSKTLLLMVFKEFTPLEAVREGCSVKGVDPRVVVTLVVNEYNENLSSINKNVYHITGESLPDNANLLALVRILHAYYEKESKYIDKIYFNKEELTNN